MAEKKKILYIVEAMGGGVFTYIVDLANPSKSLPVKFQHKRQRRSASGQDERPGGSPGSRTLRGVAH